MECLKPQSWNTRRKNTKASITNTLVTLIAGVIEPNVDIAVNPNTSALVSLRTG